MKQPFYRLILVTLILFGASGANAQQSSVKVKHSPAPGIKTEQLKQSVKTLKDSGQLKKLSPKRVKKSGADKQVKKLVKKFRRLNRNVAKASSNKLSTAATFIEQYDHIESQADSLASNSGPSEGKGACMRECADSFPGTGGGNGINRTACKLSCLILGE